MPRGTPLLDGQSGTTLRADGTVFALVLGRLERAKITAALRGEYDVRFVERGCELLNLVKGACSNVAAVMLEMRDADGRSTCDVVSQISVSKLSPPVLAYCRAGAEQSGEIRNFVLAGVRELVFDGIDDVGVALRSLLSSAQVSLIGERVADAMLATLPPILGPFVRYVTAHPETQRVADVADALGYNRKTLVNHCAQAIAPPPQELLAWCRLSVVAELLCTTPRTIESIAFQLDFPSDTALRNMMKRYTGLCASDVRARGGVRCVLDALAINLVIRSGKRVAIA
ncbi:MAG: AraC family transcriptional regulator [bacterium]